MDYFISVWDSSKILHMNGAAEVTFYDGTNFIPVGIKFAPNFTAGNLSLLFSLKWFSIKLLKLHQFES